jgi:predicted lipid carrier protein YhbT
MSAPSATAPPPHAQSRTIPFLRALPVPLFVLQPILSAIGARVAHSRPELFERLGPHARKCFVIDAIDLPFALALRPDPKRPTLTAFRRDDPPPHDAAISGTLVDLFAMIDGSADSDALFFSRDLKITGDIEAAVALRNALDDLDGSIVDNLAGAFGPLAKPAEFAVEAMRAICRRKRG